MYPLKVDHKYIPDELHLTPGTYRVPYLGTYLRDYKEKNGSHPGVDIIPQEPGSPVYAILDGKIKKSKFNDSHGNYIVIEHKNIPDPDNLLKETTLYSSYLHLEELYMKAGKDVKRGDVIGITGSTGISTGEHLHFQIDRESAPFHPYWPFTIDEAIAKGITFFEGINTGVNKALAELHTVNPLVYLDKLEEFGLFRKKSKTVNLTLESEEIDDTFDLASSFVSIDPVLLEERISDDLKVRKNKKINEVQLKDVISLDSSLSSDSQNIGITTFSEIAEGLRPSDDFVEELVDSGIICGYDDGTLRLESPITRAELLKIILKYKGYEIKESKTQHFGDVKEFYWQKKYVDTAVRYDIISPAPQLFRPDDFVTRAEAIKILIKALKIPTSKFYNSSFDDVPNDSWMNKYIAAAESEGLLMITANILEPNTSIRREEVIYALEKSNE